MIDQLPQASNFILYSAPNGDVQLNVALQDETVWLTQRGMESLFNVAKSTLSEHLKNIYECDELVREATVRNFRTVQIEGGREVARNIDYYNLDAIIFEVFRVEQDKHFVSDFDKTIKTLKKPKEKKDK